MTHTVSLIALSIGMVSALWGAGPEPRVFGAAQVQEVYRVVLDRDAMLLESINSVIKQKGIQDGHAMVTAGSVSECTYHYVTSTAVISRSSSRV